MKKTLLAAILATFVPLALAEVPYYADWPPSQWPNVNTSKAVNNNTVNNSTNATAGSTSTSFANATSSSGASTSANVLSIEQKLATAPDVISYPTAPCRISIGASGGWFGGAIGFSGSSLDEACSRIETSRHLHNLGAKEAAVQIMCLSPEAKQALEATGVKCKIAPPPQPETVKP